MNAGEVILQCMALIRELPEVEQRSTVAYLFRRFTPRLVKPEYRSAPDWPRAREMMRRMVGYTDTNYPLMLLLLRAQNEAVAYALEMLEQVWSVPEPDNKEA